MKVGDPNGIARWEADGVNVERRGERVWVRVGAMAVNGVFYKVRAEGAEIASDPRVFGEGEIDQRAVFSVLQFGAVVPPLTMWKGVMRFLPGFEYLVGPEGVVEKKGIDWEAGARVEDLNPEWQETRVEEILDGTLKELVPNGRAVILFSGGVDSGLLAARAKKLGWREVVLANYSFGTKAGEDEESWHAEAMARKLGMRFEKVTAGDEELGKMVERLPLPIVDHSMIPTGALARAVVQKFGDFDVVLDGTGADGAFGLFGKLAGMQHLYGVPRFLRGGIGSLYWFGWWRRVGRAERGLRLLRRSGQMGLRAMSVAQNALEGIAYHFDPRVKREVEGLLEEWVGGIFPAEEVVRFAGVDLALVCANIFAQKGKGIYDEAGLRIRFPFLEEGMIRLALMEASQWRGREEAKGVLKRILARAVPREMVYRPKSGFVAPLAAQFKLPWVMEGFERGIKSKMLGGIVDQRVCEILRADLAAGRELPRQTYSFIWAVVVLGAWEGQRQ